ncbi:MAG: hypothetical protein QMD85_03165, partial [Candidatus Aenigmarchaeota archaeon]|nr:hypothetical protein [Candidatus Aenigmarchaeota archaeon]MDI6722537.1 hypothetical protein [Candidatus Aenigmarchaeota archaeon]
YMILSYSVSLEDKELDRLVQEIGENIMNSELTESKGVFSEQRLNDYFTGQRPNFDAYTDSKKEEFILKTDGSDIEYINIEPDFVRHCSVAYTTKISKIKDDPGKKMKWNFGFRTTTYEEYQIASEDFPVSVKDGDEIKPATLSLTVIRSSSTRYACLAEKAKSYREKQELPLPACTSDKCTIAMKNLEGANHHVCRRAYTTLNRDVLISCRYLPDTTIIPSYFIYGKNDGKKKLVAYPLKNLAGFATIASGEADETLQSIDNCNNIASNTNVIKDPADTSPVEGVIFCLENG